jgi:hypothetical protein
MVLSWPEQVSAAERKRLGLPANLKRAADANERRYLSYQRAFFCASGVNA